jgi:hypothetical protein
MRSARRVIARNCVADSFNALDRFYAEISTAHPKLKRGKVWCKICGREESVNSADCLRTGWPKCCGQTMTIDSPEEQH